MSEPAKIDMTDMVERVARVIHGVMFPDEPQGEVWGGMGTIEGLKSIEGARAAIEVMREPMPQMEFAGADVGKADVTSGMVWRAMIDAALAETP